MQHKRTISVSSQGDAKADAVILGWFHPQKNEKDKKEKHAEPACHSKRDIKPLFSLLKESKHFTAKKNEVSLLRYFKTGNYNNVMLVGMGPEGKWNSEVLRQAGAAVYLAQKKEKLSNVCIDGDSFFSKVSSKELPYNVQAFCEGYLLAGYEYDDLKKKEGEVFSPVGAEITGLKGSALAEAAKRAEILSDAVNFSRSLGDRPGNVLTPNEFAKLSEKMAKDHGLKCTVWGKQEIQKEKMGLFWGVAKGSVEEPHFIILEHRGGKKGDAPIALIGKGITFDSGGISLKPPSRMEDMKYDMMGAASVVGIMQAVADMKIPLNITGYIATTENMPGGKAQKPGDVQKSLSGKTVEIVNTDAEGRLVLADAIEYAQKSEPQAMIDFATLTGSVVDALGSVTTGIMGTHCGLIGAMKKSADYTGERVWELPLYEEYEEDLKSSYADIRNTGIREAGASKAGIFLKFFVDSKVPWVHCDIAGSAYHRKDLNYHPAKYGAGVLVRLITNLLENWEPLK